MNKRLVVACLVASCLGSMSVPSSLQAGNRLVSNGSSWQIANSPLSVTAAADWNKLSARPGRNSESWTIDGPQLNDLTFYSGIESGKTLFREIDKRNKPLPKFDKAMLPTDVAQLLETSYRIALGTTIFEIKAMEAAQLAGNNGVHFAYSFTGPDQVARSGEATGAIIGGRLYLITFEAPAIFYFDRDVEASRAIVTSARIKALSSTR